MKIRLLWIVFGIGIGIAATFYLTRTRDAVIAQQSERPGNSIDPPIEMPHDLSGLSIKNPRIRIVHTTDPDLEGGSMYLQQVDPFLCYQWGRSLSQRNFRERDGVYGDSGKIDGILLPDGVTKMMDRSHSNSCGSCHNTPYRDGGAGMTIAKNGATGRNTPHMFGTGLMEMIGLQMRQQALAIADANGDGWISKEEMKGKRCIIRNITDDVSGDAVDIDYGSFDDENGDGYPDLNSVFWPIFVDKNGQRIAWARNLNSPEVAGYHFEVQVYGFGTPYAPFRPAISTTVRSFTTTPFDIHSGLQPHDPTTYTSPKRDGLALVSNAGAQQFISAAGKDRGSVRAPTKTGLPGISLDDPDRDGYCEEISEGDIDAVEWYLMNHPSPARGKQTADVIAGEKLFKKVGCASCHTPDWRLNAYDPKETQPHKQFAGDRRFFDLAVEWNDKTERLEGKVVWLADVVKSGKHARYVPRKKGYTVRGIYSDFKYHDVGEAFYQMQFDGTVVRKWRTTPLWGVGHTAPYGHDGGSLDLDQVTRRHGGEAQGSKEAYVALSDTERKQLLCFMSSLMLYTTDQLPTDMDGDGKIEDHFMVQDMDTGLERFNVEWLFKNPAKIEGPIRNVRGERIVSNALTNLRQAYGLDLEMLRDTDGDGFPDVIDQEPTIRGFRDGAK
ncbi:MAG: hypothetical protein K2X38_24610 [Gemmataceae bacterium]|nr:hypothetical protein [Gemmataceae bacterium]